MRIADLKIDSSWSLFLDRDGVINVRLIDDYVKSTNEFVFINGVPESISYFSSIFNRILIVTNQQGIGKGLMTKSTLESIHAKMLKGIDDKKGRIDKIYFSPHRKEENSKYRKPEIGMALHAKKDFPEINFKKSIMVGDTINDMKFGKRAGMFSVLISDDIKLIRDNHKLIDFNYKTLFDFSKEIERNN